MSSQLRKWVVASLLLVVPSVGCSMGRTQMHSSTDSVVQALAVSGMRPLADEPVWQTLRGNREEPVIVLKAQNVDSENCSLR